MTLPLSSFFFFFRHELLRGHCDPAFLKMTHTEREVNMAHALCARGSQYITKPALSHTWEKKARTVFQRI